MSPSVYESTVDWIARAMRLSPCYVTSSYSETWNELELAEKRVTKRAKIVSD
jgi:hypothetical protein